MWLRYLMGVRVASADKFNATCKSGRQQSVNAIVSILQAPGPGTLIKKSDWNPV